jgi:Fe-S oxidoreductase
MREIKNIFDPRGLFNPGKLLADGRFKMDANLRVGAGSRLALPFEPVLAFASRDDSFVANLEQCNGCGGCRKDTPTMCPTFLVTGEEIMSTRGRANTIRAALEGRFSGDRVRSEELEAALGNCLGCKACTAECPSNVNLALLKAEMLNARHARHGLSWRKRLFSSVELLGQLGCIAPATANRLLHSDRARQMAERFLGVSAKRPLPAYAAERFDHWFARRKRASSGRRGRVLLWDDTFVRYHEPHIGQAAVAVLEAAGFTPALVAGRKCCGRPAFSQGRLDVAAAHGRHNLELLTDSDATEPILFLEPSCYSMFAEDYLELKLSGAAEVKSRCFLFEEFIDNLLAREPGAIAFKNSPEKVAIHAIATPRRC